MKVAEFLALMEATPAAEKARIVTLARANCAEASGQPPASPHSPS